MLVDCRNCRSKYSAKFCPECGQSATVHEMDWKFLWNDFRYIFFSHDSALFLTLRDLLLRPGYFINEYMDGLRVRRISPVRLILTLAGLYTLILVGFKISLPIETTEGSSDNIRQFNDLAKGLIMSHFALAEVALVPIVALSTFISFAKSKKSLAFHFATGAYLVSQVLVVKIIFLLVAVLTGHRSYGLLIFLPNLLTLPILGRSLFQQFRDFSAIERVIRISSSILLFFVGFSSALLTVYFVLN